MGVIVLNPAQIKHFKKIGWIETNEDGAMKFKDDAPALPAFKVVPSFPSIPKEK